MIEKRSKSLPDSIKRIKRGKHFIRNNAIYYEFKSFVDEHYAGSENYLVYEQDIKAHFT